MPDDDRAAYIRALVAHRCPEIGPADLAAIAAGSQPDAIASTEAVMPVEIGDLIIDAIVALEEKVDWLADAVGVNKDEDEDDDATRRRAGA